MTAPATAHTEPRCSASLDCRLPPGPVEMVARGIEAGGVEKESRAEAGAGQIAEGQATDFAVSARSFWTTAAWTAASAFFSFRLQTHIGTAVSPQRGEHGGEADGMLHNTKLAARCAGGGGGAQGDAWAGLT